MVIGSSLEARPKIDRGASRGLYSRAADPPSQPDGVSRDQIFSPPLSGRAGRLRLTGEGKRRGAMTSIVPRVQPRDLVHHPVRGPGGGRPAVGRAAEGRRPAGTMRLAAGSLWGRLADRAGGISRDGPG